MKTIINFRGKKYRFSYIPLILFPLGLIFSVPLILQISERIQIVWLQELFAKHVVFFLNLFYKVGARTMYYPEFPCPWYITIPDAYFCPTPEYCYPCITYINNGCTGILAMCLFSVIFLFAPYSNHQKTKDDILWRKSIAIIIAITSIYLYNVFRATIQIYLYSKGYAWSVIHDSEGILAITVSFHVAIFLICTILVPEWFLLIYYVVKNVINYLKRYYLAEIIYDLSHKRDRKQFYWIRKRFKTEGMDLYLIKIHEIDLRLIKFLKKNKQKYTAKAIKRRLFAKEEEISEIFLEKILQILVDDDWILSNIHEQKRYYFI
ncbi:MAG: hypothetical protein EU551_04495 [Promethearchaeota archaeon]|nr:MAG: hypothetical protein EU551_04495 [Candidatus Lokiarchaeota archaeon]